MENNELLQKIEILEKKMADLESKRGLRGFFRRAFTKSSFIVGIALAAALTGFLAWAAQNTFSDGTVISADAVNNNFNELYAAMTTAESFLGELTNKSDLIPNGGYANFNPVQNSNTDVFEVVSTSPYGVKIKKPGKVFFNIDMDILFSTGSYVYITSTVDSITISQSIVGPTGGYFDGIHNGGVYNVSENQVLKFQIVTSGATITNIDNGSWSRLSILWIGNPN